jgi:hypothetical protein
MDANGMHTNHMLPQLVLLCAPDVVSADTGTYCTPPICLASCKCGFLAALNIFYMLVVALFSPAVEGGPTYIPVPGKARLECH